MCPLGWALIGRLWERICFQVHSGYWQNLVPCSCKTEVPIFLQVATRDCSQLLEASLRPFPGDSLHFQVSNNTSNSPCP